MFVKFCYGTKEEYSSLSEKAVKVPFHFSTTYLCEAKFSLCSSTKTTCHIRVNVEEDKRIQLSCINPNSNKICKQSKRCHFSH